MIISRADLKKTIINKFIKEQNKSPEVAEMLAETCLPESGDDIKLSDNQVEFMAAVVADSKAGAAKDEVKPVIKHVEAEGN